MGTLKFYASLHVFELAELESLEDYLRCETIEKAYQHKIEAHMAQYDEKIRQALAKHQREISACDNEQCKQDHVEFRAQLARQEEFQGARKDLVHHLTYFVSFGLPFLHRVHQQIARDGGQIIPANYPFLRYHSCTGCGSRRMYRGDATWDSYTFRLLQDRGPGEVNKQSAIWRAPEHSSGACRPNASTVHLRTLPPQCFRVEELWRANCFMWE